MSQLGTHSRIRFLIVHLHSVFPNLVIYHEIRDFEHEPRDKNFCSVTSHESPKVCDFGNTLGNSQKNGKIPLFLPKKYQNCSLKTSDQNFFKKNSWFFRDFEVYCSWFSWFLRCFFARDFRDFFALKSGFSRKIIWEHWQEVQVSTFK